MKVPPTNNINAFNTYDEHYYNDAVSPHSPPGNGNGNVDEYVPPPAEDTDFSEYMWMENEEEFDKEVLQRLEEEELMEQCMLQHMLNDDRPQQTSNAANLNNPSQHNKVEPSEMAKGSTLNPHAAEFIPSWSRTSGNEQKSS